MSPRWRCPLLATPLLGALPPWAAVLCCHRVCAGPWGRRLGGGWRRGHPYLDTTGLHCVSPERAFWRWKEAPVFSFLEYLEYLKRKKKNGKNWYRKL